MAMVHYYNTRQPVSPIVFDSPRAQARLQADIHEACILYAYHVKLSKRAKSPEYKSYHNGQASLFLDYIMKGSRYAS
jgi:hypothetical protein